MRTVTAITIATLLRIIVIIIDLIKSTSIQVINASTGVNPSMHVPIAGDEHGNVPTRGARAKVRPAWK